MKSFLSGLALDRLPPTRVGPTITISGPAASGKSSTAKMVAEKLGLKHISMGMIFREMANEVGLTLEEFLKDSTAKFHNKADKRQLEYAMTGGVLVEGRLGGWVAGTHADIRIWLTAPQQCRINRYAERQKVSLDTATELLVKRDTIDLANYKRIYNIDFSDLYIYDFVISNEYTNLEETVDIICHITNIILNKKPKA